MTPRKVCFVTGSRAEYGLLRWLMADVAADPALQLQLVVSAMHLAPEFGLTYREIEADGFHIDAKVEMLLSSDTPVGIAKSMGMGVMGYAEAFARLDPALLIVLGDRFEILAAAQAALVRRLPIVHIHGGEASEGAFDDAIRHAITKMSHLHFTAAEPYRQRVIQMGEAPDRVFNVGAIGLDNLERLSLLDRVELARAIGFRLDGGPLILCTYHPVTLSGASPDEQLDGLFAALDAVAEARVVFTKANADTGGRVINNRIDQYVATRPEGAVAFTSLGAVKYLSLLRTADVVVGNSSSGIIEAPAVGTATVNIGARQSGRLKASSIIDCAEDAASITTAIRRALSCEFRAAAAKPVTHYGHGGASAAILSVLKHADLNGIVHKHFYDVGFHHR